MIDGRRGRYGDRDVSTMASERVEASLRAIPRFIQILGSKTHRQ